MIDVQSLSKSYDGKQPFALDAISFHIDKNEIVGFVGLNGAGKTTTIRVLAGVSLPSSGRAILDSHDIVTDKVAASRCVGWVPEFPNYEMGSSALGLMKYFSGFYGIRSAIAIEQSMILLERVGLAGFEKRKLRTYSQGMKKRFSLAASMVSDPQNLLFDEILNGLDPEGVQFARELMTELRNSGKSILLSSHILKEVQALSDRVMLIHHGRIVRVLTKDEMAASKTGLEEQFFEVIGSREENRHATTLA